MNPAIRGAALFALLLATAAGGETPAGTETPAGAEAAATASGLFARDTYRIDPLVCPFRERIDYEPGEIECGLLQVPENREDPESRFIELHFVKLSSTWDEEEERDEDDDEASGLAPGKRDDPIVYLTGGPGARAEYYVKRFKDHGIRRHRDLYILEQRGIGASGDFCVNYYTRNPATFDVESLEEQAEAQLSRRPGPASPASCRRTPRASRRSDCR